VSRGSETEMQEVAQRWLAARRRFYEDDDASVLADYLAADERLLEAFTDNWENDDQMMTEAYGAFRKILVGSCESAGARRTVYHQTQC